MGSDFYKVFLVTAQVVLVAAVVELIVLFSSGHFLIGGLKSRIGAIAVVLVGYLGFSILVSVVVAFAYRMLPQKVHRRSDVASFAGAGAVFFISSFSLLDYVSRKIVMSPFQPGALKWAAGSLAVALALSVMTLVLLRVARQLTSRIRPLQSLLALAGLVVATILVPGPSRLGASIEGEDHVQRPNVILISLDTVRADALSAYGCPLPTTETIDRIAAEGVLFEKAYAQEKWTLPSHASIFTSLYPPGHGAQTANGVIGPDHISLAEVLKDQGYATCALVDGDEMGNIGSRRGFDRGFDFYEHFPANRSIREAFLPFRIVTDFSVFFISRHSESLVRSATDWIDLATEIESERPFFLFLHVYDAHAAWGGRWPLHHLPYTAHLPFLSKEVGIGKPDKKRFIREGRTATLYLKSVNDAAKAGTPTAELVAPQEVELLKQLYLSSVSYIDSQLAGLDEFLERRGLVEDTIVVITSDHGEEFLEHDRFAHVQHYRETLHVPFIIRYPEQVSAGTRVDEIVQLIDIAPTILDLCRIETPGQFQGRSLLPFLQEETAAGQGAETHGVTFVANGVRQQFGVRTPEFYYFVRGARKTEPAREELFDLHADPFEQEDISTLAPERLERARAMMEDWMSLYMTEDSGERMELDDRTREMLTGLGYIID